MVSWRNPDARHREWGLDTYVQAVIEALDAVARDHRRGPRAPARRLLGRHHRRDGRRPPGRHRPAGPARRRSPCWSPCSTRPGPAPPARWSTSRPRPPAIAASRARGYLDGRALAEVFAWLRPSDLIWNYWVNNYLHGRKPPAFDILFWNADTTRMTATLHRDFVDHRDGQHA